MKRSEALEGIRRDLACIRALIKDYGEHSESPSLAIAEWLLRDLDRLWPVVDAAVALDDAVAEFGATLEYVSEHFQNLSDAIDRSKIREDGEPPTKEE